MLASPNQQSRSLILTASALTMIAIRGESKLRAPSTTLGCRLITTIAVADGKKGDLSPLDQYWK
jgi:hypothetical protein